MLNYREATILDIPALHRVRMSVNENKLNNPLLVTRSDYELFLTLKGKGWLCEIENQVVGFAIVDTESNNIWALFLDPSHEGKGIGKTLQRIMLDWYFDQKKEKLWLGTAPGTRAEKFYTITGWKNCGLMKNGEVRFEMDYDCYQSNFKN